MSDVIGVKWECKWCGRTTETAVEQSHIHVPTCDHGGNESGRPRVCNKGVLVFGETTLSDALRDDRIYRHLVALLNAVGTTMADGRPSTEFCRACEERPHMMRSPCTCPCHAARALVTEYMEKAA